MSQAGHSIGESRRHVREDPVPDVEICEREQRTGHSNCDDIIRPVPA